MQQLEVTEPAAARRARRTVAVALVALAALLATGGVALAHGGGGGDSRRWWGVGGTVTEVGTSSLTVETRDGSSKEVLTTDDTRYFLTEAANVADAEPGTFVIVKGDRYGDRDDDPSTVDAHRVAIVPAPDNPPAKDRRHHLAGTVLENDGTTLVVDTGDGEVTVTIDDATKVTKTTVALFADLADGQHVWVRGERNEDGGFTASVVHIKPASVEASRAAFFAAMAAEAMTTTTLASTTTTMVVATAAAAMVDDTDDDPIVKVAGVIATLDDPLLTVKKRDGTVVPITTTADTVYVVKADGSETTGSFGDLAVGDKIVVEGTQADDGVVTATRIFTGDCDRDGWRDRDRDRGEVEGDRWDDGDRDSDGGDRDGSFDGRDGRDGRR